MDERINRLKVPLPKRDLFKIRAYASPVEKTTSKDHAESEDVVEASEQESRNAASEETKAGDDRERMIQMIRQHLFTPYIKRLKVATKCSDKMARQFMQTIFMESFDRAREMNNLFDLEEFFFDQVEKKSVELLPEYAEAMLRDRMAYIDEIIALLGFKEAVTKELRNRALKTYNEFFYQIAYKNVTDRHKLKFAVLFTCQSYMHECIGLSATEVRNIRKIEKRLEDKNTSTQDGSG